MDVGDFLSAFMHHLETVRPPTPMPDNASAAAAHAAARAGGVPVLVGPGSASAAERFVRDEGRRRWIASVTLDDIVSAGTSFCRKTIKQLRDERCGVEDGRMVYAGKRDAPLLDVVRSGFLRAVVAPADRADTTANGAPIVADVPRRATTCHRVAVYRLDYDEEVMDDAMVIDAVVSQSDVVRFLHRHSDALVDVLRVNLRDIGLGGDWDDEPGVGARQEKDEEETIGGGVSCVLPTTRALEAFSAMRADGVSVVGVVREPRGPLVDCLSVSDLRGVSEARLADLDLPVARFTASRRPAGSEPRLVTVRPDADLGDALAKMSSERVHHVFVTDLEGRPIRVVTPTDVFRAMALPSTDALGWRFQAAEARASYAFEETRGREREAARRPGEVPFDDLM